MEKWGWVLDRKKKLMGTVHTVVCVKHVKKDMPESEWDETMPLPGDIIEGVAEETDQEYVSTKAKSELSTQLARLNRHVDVISVKVRRGDEALKLRACVVAERYAKLQRRFTLRAASDDRHVVILGDLTLDECTELQEMSKRVMNHDSRGFNRKGMKYDWKKKVGTYLPDQRCTVISSILFMPYTSDYSVDPTTARSMAWFSSAVSSGVPLVFVNIQTEQVITSEEKHGASSNGHDTSRGRHQNSNTTIQILQGIRLWFLPGVAELPVMLTPELGENRFGMDIKRTDEGFMTVHSVAKGSAAERAGLGRLHQQARCSRHLLIISRLEGKSLTPSTVSTKGLINCCDHANVKEELASAIDRMDGVLIHVMVWPTSENVPTVPMDPATLRPPESCHLAIHQTACDDKLGHEHVAY